MIREQPWHSRYTTQEHETWYRDLVDFHSLTVAWLEGLDQKEALDQTPLLPRAVIESPGLAESLWLLESLAKDVKHPEAMGLQRLLDDTHPEDVLGRLEQMVWSIQALTLAHLFKEKETPEHPALLNQLEQISWKMGRSYALKHWNEVDPTLFRDMRSIFAAFRGSPFSRFNRIPVFLIERSVSTEVRALIRHSVFNHPLPEVYNRANSLFQLHLHWAQGFTFALNPRASIEACIPSTQNTKGTFRWHLAH